MESSILDQGRAAVSGETVPTDERDAELERLRSENAQLRQRGQRRRAAGPTLDLSEKSGDERADAFKEWPVRGGSDELPQPWDLQALGLRAESQDLAERPAGAADTVSPVRITHGRPVLTSGSADTSVHDLGRQLGDLGFPNSVSRGENPFGVVDQSVMDAVAGFRAEFGVEEDPTPFGGRHQAAQAKAANHIGPWTFEAVNRAHQNEQQG